MQRPEVGGVFGQLQKCHVATGYSSGGNRDEAQEVGWDQIVESIMQ